MVLESLYNRYALARIGLNDWQSRFEFSKMMNKEKTIKAARELPCDVKIRFTSSRCSVP